MFSTACQGQLLPGETLQLKWEFAQASDSNRFQPGAGHLDWPAWPGAPDSAGYTGHLALECGLSGGDTAEALRSVPPFLARAAA